MPTWCEPIIGLGIITGIYVLGSIVIECLFKNDPNENRDKERRKWRNKK